MPGSIATLDSIGFDGTSNCLSVARQIAALLNRDVSVIEIGTAYGDALSSLSCPQLKRLTCVDPMYDWVPDITPDEAFDSKLIDSSKVARWRENAQTLGEGVTTHLIVGKSCDVARNGVNSVLLSDSDILVIDGCHHPVSAVEADYWDFEPFMNAEHFAVFDDLNHGCPRAAFEAVISKLGESVVSSGSIGDRVGVIHVRRVTAS